MLDVRLNYHSSRPLYKQIADQIRQLIATEQLKSGDRLPTVRDIARSLKVNQNTVIKAYLELERENILSSRRGGGTIVSSSIDDPVLQVTRQKRLSDIVNEDILKLLSQGYKPPELEAAFYLHLARWSEERQASIEKPPLKTSRRRAKNIIHIVGSHDLALNVLLSLLKEREKGIETEVTHAGSLGGLIALQEDRADLAGIHLLDEETGEYNYPFVKRILPGRSVAIVNLSYRIQGLMFAAGNPKQIKGLGDLINPDLTFVNRQKGSGTRVLLELQLKKQGIVTSDIKGYDHELDTHLAVASTIAQGKADTGLGIEAAALGYDLDFLPLFRERYDLVIPEPNYHSKLFAPLLSIISSDEFKNIVDRTGGYDTSQTGTTTFI
jgi:molybdate-binding protein/DNA-binding transcriptional regulator YhcF (GntR family)